MTPSRDTTHRRGLAAIKGARGRRPRGRRPVKLGLGLYRDLLTDDNFRFARQAGATHIVAHLTNYFAGSNPNLSSGGADEGWGSCEGALLWSQEELDGLVAAARRHGLEVG